ncbi:MAG TPA: methyltransferase domain-containing protein [Mycobacterium sp.]
MNSTVPPALRRALELFADPPAHPDVSKGYLDLLAGEGGQAVPTNTGAIQKMWASSPGSLFWDNVQTLARRFSSAWHPPTDWLSIPQGGTALDVGCGPGTITALLARVAGKGGLALGVDVSEPMLARAVRAGYGPQVGFMRADAQRLPLRDDTVDAVVSVAVVQLIPDPDAAIAEMARVLRPGGRLAVMVPTAGHPGPLFRLLPNPGAHFFGEDELGDLLEDNGFTAVRTKTLGTIQWVRGIAG